jgi:hypothetical protein
MSGNDEAKFLQAATDCLDIARVTQDEQARAARGFQRYKKVRGSPTARKQTSPNGNM